jgi:group I intron endonuclease
MIVVYCAEDIINGKKYVGKTARFAKRLAEHENEAKASAKTAFHLAIQKYGFDVFLFSILKECQDTKEANEVERFYILKLKTHVSTDLGYNMTWGGDGTEPGDKNPNFGREVSDKTRKLRSIIVTEIWKRPGERKRRRLVLIKSHNEPEYIEGVIKRNKESWQDQEIRSKRIEGIKKHHENSEYREKMRKAQLKAWNRPGERRRRSDAMKKGWAARKKRLSR